MRSASRTPWASAAISGTMAKSCTLAGAKPEAGDQPGPVQTQVHPETVEGLPGCVIPPESSLSPEPLTAVGLGERQTGKGKLSTMAKAGSYGMEPGRICQICSLTHQRLAAWRTKVVRQTWAIAGKKWL